MTGTNKKYEVKNYDELKRTNFFIPSTLSGLDMLEDECTDRLTMTLEMKIYGVWEPIAYGVKESYDENEHYYLTMFLYESTAGVSVSISLDQFAFYDLSWTNQPDENDEMILDMKIGWRNDDWEALEFSSTNEWTLTVVGNTPTSEEDVCANAVVTKKNGAADKQLTFDPEAEWDIKDIYFENALNVTMTGANETECPIFYFLSIWDATS
jgi:hypothetical protein